jgi:hypothetical protein
MSTWAYPLEAAQNRLTEEELRRVWQHAAQFDGSIASSSRLLAKLAGKQVIPESYSRSCLFENMTHCRPSLFWNFPVQRYHRGSGPDGVERLIDNICRGFPRIKRARVRRRALIEYLSLPNVMKRWANAKTVFGITDLHYIGTRFDHWVDTKRLNDFNLLPRGTDGYQSQDSLVISSLGAVTDSHSDDHSGSNHCFTGAKLWLLWDTQEGLEYGLEDVERCYVKDRERAAFDVAAFTAMKSSRWIFIGPGQTMFIPAHLTHKVVTLERYLGLGSFHAGLPGFVDLLVRWHDLPPLWARYPSGDPHRSVTFITERAIRKLKGLQAATRPEQARWGIPQLLERLKLPDLRARSGRDSSGRDSGLIESNPELARFVRAAAAFA